MDSKRRSYYHQKKKREREREGLMIIYILDLDHGVEMVEESRILIAYEAIAIVTSICHKIKFAINKENGGGR